ncbi:MAG: hypothetical protein V3T79_04120 [Candidatus Scalindua sediminis]
MDNRKPEPVSIEKELHICPECGYEDGFHTSFSRVADKKCKIILICPSCHAMYDVNWEVAV